MGDLKNKFMGILFEDEPETEIDEESTQDSDTETISVESKISAKDLLYRKSGTSPFIDLEDSSRDIEEFLSEPEEYEMSAQISPIFGVIRKEEKKVVQAASQESKSQTIKPIDSHLDIITSPIYGYGNKEDALNNKEINETIINEDESLNSILDKDEPIDIDVMSDDSSYEDEISLFRLFGDNK